jgi:hypothetical protein
MSGAIPKVLQCKEGRKKEIKNREIGRWGKSATPVPILLIAANADTQNQFGEDDAD